MRVRNAALVTRRESIAVLVLIVVAVAYFSGQVVRGVLTPPPRPYTPHAQTGRTI